MRLDDEAEEWIALATTPSEYRWMFVARAAQVVAAKCGSDIEFSLRCELIASKLNRFDVDGVRRFAIDLGASDGTTRMAVTQFIPGNHFHVADIGKKFDSLAKAVTAIEKAGHEYSGLRKVHSVQLSGD